MNNYPQKHRSRAICFSVKQIPANQTFLTSVNIRIMSPVGHARANEKKKIENFQVLMEILESLFLLICLDLSHGLIVSKVLCQESFYGDYRRSFFFFA